jgi:tryptophan synthase beta subunit
VERKISILIKMGKINLDIDDNLERELRKVAVEKFEARKGFLKKAIEEAIRDWIRKNSKGVKNV